MTEQNNAAPVAVQAEPCPKAGNLSRLAMEDAANEALSIGLAVSWINEANGVLEEIRLMAAAYPEFKQMLNDRGVAFNSADWSGCEMTAYISRVLTRQHILIQRMRRVLEG